MEDEVGRQPKKNVWMGMPATQWVCVYHAYWRMRQGYISSVSSCSNL